MSFSFQCPVCKSIREAAEHLYGKVVRCADCDHFVTVDDSTIIQTAPNHDITNNEEQLTQQKQNPYDVKQSESASAGNPELSDPARPAASRADYQEVAAGSPPSSPATSSQGGHKGTGTVPPETDDGEFEEFGLPKRDKFTDDEMDMTPMVDVTFLLLIFFMVTASFTLQKSMDLPTKTQDEPSPNVVEDFEDNPEYVSVFVSSYNEYRIRTSEYDWEDAPNRHELRVRLTDALQAASKPEKMLIMAHADCFHDKVIQAMDIGIELKYKIQVIMTEEEF
jgi:biopolymer transport protein ExbD